NGLIVDGFDSQVRPVRFAHGEPVAIRLQAPLEHELGLVLLARNQPDDVFVESRRRGVGFDVRRPAVTVLAAQVLFDVVFLCCHVFSREGCDQSSGLMGMTRRPSASFGGVSVAGWASCARVTLSRASRIATLIRCHALPTLQCDSMLHWLWLLAHSVMPTSPSMASMMSAAVIASGGLANTYPPFAPRCETSRPLRVSCFSSLLTVGR